MQQIKVSNFKGISEDVHIELPSGDANLVVFGDNGSGKTSLFEAIRLAYFGEDLKRPEIPTEAVEEEINSTIATWLNSYTCKHGSGGFAIELDSVAVNPAAPSNVPAFMIDGMTLSLMSDIRTSELINYRTVHIPGSQIVYGNVEEIVNRVNAVLTEYFNEEFKAVPVQDNPDRILLRDASRNIPPEPIVGRSFNESKIKLTRILLFLENALAVVPQQGPTPLLVLDDFITSLDASNRLCLLRYIFDRFSSFQKILLTHNASFFNLIRKFEEDYQTTGQRWKYGNLYMSGSRCVFYNYRESDNIDQIKNAYQANPADLNGTANSLRRRFEILVHEFTKQTLLEAHSEMKEMLRRMLNENPLYLKKDNGKLKYAADLIDEIKVCLNASPASQLRTSLEGIIGAYDTTLTHARLRQALRVLKLYQKIVMHQGSHQQGGLPTISSAEIELSILWLKKLETTVKELAPGGNPYHI